MFIFHRDEVSIFMLVYVDDIVSDGSSIAVIDHLVSSLAAAFPITDHGPLDYFLGP